jgi:hypothetical protein
VIELTAEEYATIYEALRLVNAPYGNDEVAHIVAMEAKAWTAIKTATHRAGLDDVSRPSGAYQS